MTRRRIAALAVDVDGTLLNPDHRISDAVAAAVADLRAAGVKVILASARYPGSMLGIQAELGVLGELFVGSQGGVAGRFADGRFELLGGWPIEPGATRGVLDVAEAMGLPVSHFSADVWTVEIGDPMIDHEVEIVEHEPAFATDLRLLAEPAYKLSIKAPPGREPELAEAARRLPDGVRGAISSPNYLEIVDRHVSKATGVAAALAALGITPEQLAAAGDGANDVEMVRLAALGMAMGHAPASLHAVATWSLPSSADDGLAVGIRRLLAAGLNAGGDAA